MIYYDTPELVEDARAKKFPPHDKLFVWVTWSKSPMIAFHCDDEILCGAFNSAISGAGKLLNWNLFHQIGTTELSDNAPGFHGWETWSGASPHDLDNQLETIEATAIDLWLMRHRFFTGE